MRLANPRRGAVPGLGGYIRIPHEDNKAFSKLSKGFQVLQGVRFPAHRSFGIGPGPRISLRKNRLAFFTYRT